MQKILNAGQVAAFYHDQFVEQQVDHFQKIALPPSLGQDRVVVDVGGGCGYFANALKKRFGIAVRVIDMDPLSVSEAHKLGVEALVGDALQPNMKNDDGVACLNLILHHLVASSDKETLMLQSKAISSWKGNNVKVFVNEYIYESWFGNFSGWLIYQITKNQFLSAVGRTVARLVPSLNANTFGVGVRFRSSHEWKRIFERLGFEVADELKGEKEFISLPRRLLLIKEIRRDSFLLVEK
jgi:SAM-dependent methyltransferase